MVYLDKIDLDGTLPGETVINKVRKHDGKYFDRR